MSKDKSGSWFGRHKILTGLGALIIIGIFASAAGGGNTNTANNSGGSAPSDNQQQKPAAQVAKIGEAARDGKFEFVVKNIECGRATIGANQYLTKTAQGQFCLLTVNVKNVGNEAQGLFGSNQKLLNANNQQYAADDTAAGYLDQNYTTLFSNINPGNSVEGIIVFDIPKDQTAVAAELHDSAFSSGVKVNLQ